VAYQAKTMLSRSIDKSRKIAAALAAVGPSQKL
jgi:hypothetical protein